MRVVSSQNSALAKIMKGPRFVDTAEIVSVVKSPKKDRFVLTLRAHHNLAGIPNPRMIVLEDVPVKLSHCELSYDGRYFRMLVSTEKNGRHVSIRERDN